MMFLFAITALNQDQQRQLQPYHTNSPERLVGFHQKTQFVSPSVFNWKYNKISQKKDLDPDTRKNIPKKNLPICFLFSFQTSSQQGPSLLWFCPLYVFYGLTWYKLHGHQARSKLTFYQKQKGKYRSFQLPSCISDFKESVKFCSI